MEMNVIMSSDEKYAPYMGITITSILENNKKFDNIIVHVLDGGISSENLNKMDVLKKKYSFFDYKIYDASIIKNWMPELKKGSIGELLGYGAFGRLFIHKFLSDDVDKVLYLDADIVVDNDLYGLYNTDLSENYCAGVIDILNTRWIYELGMDKDTIFVNSGVLLINLKKWREDNVEKKFIEFMNKSHGTDLNDQNVINSVFTGSIGILDLKYNFINELSDFSYHKHLHRWKLKDYWSCQEFENAKKNPSVIHYAAPFFMKPWVENSKTYMKKVYLNYKKISPWNNIPLEIFKLNLRQKNYMLINKTMILLPTPISLFLVKMKSLL